MGYFSFQYALIVAAAFILYHLTHLQYRWLVLFIASIAFYIVCVKNPIQLVCFAATIIVAFAGGLIIERCKINKGIARSVYLASIVLVLIPLFASKLLVSTHLAGSFSLVVPVGVSYYTLQLIAYLSDVYHEKIAASRKFFRFFLFVSFFPQIIQGPIPRYDQLYPQLIKGHRFDPDDILSGVHMIIWGLFLKTMIADRAGTVVNNVFDNAPAYLGIYALTAGILYSIQLYADFQACVKISQGVSRLFGIKLIDNFHQPYFSRSIGEFWRRWHISLSTWLRDYVYIPLGGGRKSEFRKDLNQVIVFLISGIWHMSHILSYQFLIWGGMHAFYQVVERKTGNFRSRIRKRMKIEDDSLIHVAVSRVVTCFLVMIAWIMFRASNALVGVRLISSIFMTHNPWILWDDSLLRLGLTWKEWIILSVSIVIMGIADALNERSNAEEWFMKQHCLLRWVACVFILSLIFVFGSYGHGYNAASFIYGGF